MFDTSTSSTESTVPQNAPECPNWPDDLNEKQRVAIELLVSGRSYTAAAQAMNVDRKTLFRWRQDALFQQALEERHMELWSEATQRLRGLVHPSLDVLEQDLNQRYDRARFRAAATILRLAKVGGRG
jgi:transposase-like protein